MKYPTRDLSQQEVFYFIIQGANDTYYQIWYEDYASLATKYSVVVRYDLKGKLFYHFTRPPDESA